MQLIEVGVLCIIYKGYMCVWSEGVRYMHLCVRGVESIAKQVTISISDVTVLQWVFFSLTYTNSL